MSLNLSEVRIGNFGEYIDVLNAVYKDITDSGREIYVMRSTRHTKKSMNPRHRLVALPNVERRLEADGSFILSDDDLKRLEGIAVASVPFLKDRDLAVYPFNQADSCDKFNLVTLARLRDKGLATVYDPESEIDKC